MVEVDGAVIEEAVHEGESMTMRDLIELIERSHDEQAGIDRATLAAYAEELAAQRDYAFDAEGFLSAVDEKRTDTETWVGLDRLYDLGDGQVSLYPARWHEELGGSTDVAAYLRYVTEEAPQFIEDEGRGGASFGIPEDTLMGIIATVGRVDRQQAQAAIEAAREDGEVVEDVDQHPQAGVYLAEQVDEGGG